MQAYEFVYVMSKRGTKLVLFDGNTYTPNTKDIPGQMTRSWKCSLYHRQKCKGRVSTYETIKGTRLRVSYALHSHERMVPNSHERITPDTVVSNYYQR